MRWMFVCLLQFFCICIFLGDKSYLSLDHLSYLEEDVVHCGDAEADSRHTQAFLCSHYHHHYHHFRNYHCPRYHEHLRRLQGLQHVWEDFGRGGRQQDFNLESLKMSTQSISELSKNIYLLTRIKYSISSLWTNVMKNVIPTL